MTVQVTFRGPIVYLNRGDVAVMTLIPNGERVVFDERGRLNRHPDGAPSFPHFRGLPVFTGDSNEIEVARMRLRGKVVRLIAEDAEGEECTIDASYNSI